MLMKASQAQMHFSKNLLRLLLPILFPKLYKTYINVWVHGPMKKHLIGKLSCHVGYMRTIEGTIPTYRFMFNLNSFLTDKASLILHCLVPGV